MKQLKALLLASIAMLFTTNANAVNMAPIITYLLSDTVREIPPTACDVNMTLDVNETTVICEWKYLPSAYNTSTAVVLNQGNYGIFNLSGDSLTYTKNTEGNETDSGVLEITNGTNTTEVEIEINALYWKQVSGGTNFTIAIKSDGTLWGWGSNGGKLGDGTLPDSLVPVQEFTKGNDWVSVSAGWYHATAIKTDGTLWSWGDNYYGQLGDGTKDDSRVPIQEATKATNWTSVSTGNHYTVALKSNGTLWAWGRNGEGQLGDGTETDSNVSTQEFTGATDWIAISAGDYHTTALKSNGTLWAWGENGRGQLCDGTTTDRNVSTQEVTEATDWIAVSAGDDLTTALKSNGTIWSCGYGYTGGIGDGSTTVSVAFPTQEDTNSTDWTSISAGASIAHAIKSDGTLWSWGRNHHGQIGDGTEEDKLVPTQEATGSIDWISVSAGGYHTTHATKSDSSLWGWGYNSSGQLGDGTEVDKNVSTPILPRDYD